jgi:RHS repeat-associated protein
VTYLVNSSQSLAASYRYDPYGNTISSSGSLAGANVYRFSSKLYDANSGLYYYGYRWYAPNLQRWLNRDPIAEHGGLNLYGFVRNNPANLIDSDGRAPMGWPVVPPPGYPPSIPPKPPSDTSIRKCNRKIENPSNDFVIGCANLRGHDYFDWPDGDGGRDGVGYPGQGTLPTSEAGSQPRSCRPCYKSNSPLKHGAGAGKSGTSASDDEIKDCLKNRPIKGNYHGLCNNCNDWASGAAKDCGLFCP